MTTTHEQVAKALADFANVPFPGKRQNRQAVIAIAALRNEASKRIHEMIFFSEDPVLPELRNKFVYSIVDAILGPEDS